MNILSLISHTIHIHSVDFVDNRFLHVFLNSFLLCAHVCAGEQLSSFSPAAVHPAVVAGVRPEPLGHLAGSGDHH